MRIITRLWRPAAAMAGGLSLVLYLGSTQSLHAGPETKPENATQGAALSGTAASEAPPPPAAFDTLAAVLKDPSTSAADRAEAHYDLALLLLTPDSAWRDLPKARWHLGKINPDAMRRSRNNEVLVLLDLTTELIEKEKAIKAVMQTVIGEDPGLPPVSPEPPSSPQPPSSTSSPPSPEAESQAPAPAQ